MTVDRGSGRKIPRAVGSLRDNQVLIPQIISYTYTNNIIYDDSDSEDLRIVVYTDLWGEL